MNLNFIIFSIFLCILNSQLVINEINYNSSENLDSGDWFEIYNPNNEIIDISGYIFKDDNDDHQYIMPDQTLMNPLDYLIVCRDIELFSSIYPDVDMIGGFDFGLSGSGDMVRLYSENGTIVDSVEYDDSLPWPEGADGNGFTLELLNHTMNNSSPESWSQSIPGGTPGYINSTFLKSQPCNILSQNHTLINNFPNPFNPSTDIHYELVSSGYLNISIFDLNGKITKILKNEYTHAGKNYITWDASNNSSGIYFVRLEIDDYIKTKKIILEK